MVVADVEDRENVGMIQRRSRSSFLRKSLQAIVIAGERSGKDLDGNGAVEAGVVGAIDLAHSACADRRLNFVRAKMTSSGEGHIGMSDSNLVRCKAIKQMGEDAARVSGERSKEPDCSASETLRRIGLRPKRPHAVLHRLRSRG